MELVVGAVAWLAIGCALSVAIGRRLHEVGEHYPPVPEAAQGGVAQREGAAPSCGAAGSTNAEQDIRRGSPAGWPPT